MYSWSNDNTKFKNYVYTDGRTKIWLDTDALPYFLDEAGIAKNIRGLKTGNNQSKILEAFALQVQNCGCNTGPQIQKSIVYKESCQVGRKLSRQVL